MFSLIQTSQIHPLILCIKTILIAFNRHQLWELKQNSQPWKRKEIQVPLSHSLSLSLVTSLCIWAYLFRDFSIYVVKCDCHAVYMLLTFSFFNSVFHWPTFKFMQKGLWITQCIKFDTDLLTVCIKCSILVWLAIARHSVNTKNACCELLLSGEMEAVGS